MSRFLPRSKEVFLGVHHAESLADLEREAAAAISSSGPEAGGLRGPGARSGALVALCRLPHRVSIPVVCLVALLWALVLGQASFAGSVPNPEKVPSPDGPSQATKAVRVVSHDHAHIAPWENGSALPSDVKFRPSRRTHHSSHLNGGRTSDDPNDDDDAWNYLSADDDHTDASITLWLPEIALDLMAPEAQSTSAWTSPPSSPSLMCPPLRC